MTRPVVTAEIAEAMRLNAEGVLLLESGDGRASIAFFEQARQIFESVYGPGHLRVAGTLTNLAQALLLDGEIGRAKVYCLRAMAIEEAMDGRARMADMANTMCVFGLVLMRDGQRRRRYMRWIERGVDYHRRSRSDSHPGLTEMKILLEYIRALESDPESFTDFRSTWRAAVARSRAQAETAERAHRRGHPQVERLRKLVDDADFPSDGDGNERADGDIRVIRRSVGQTIGLMVLAWGLGLVMAVLAWRLLHRQLPAGWVSTAAEYLAVGVGVAILGLLGATAGFVVSTIRTQRKAGPISVLPRWLRWRRRAARKDPENLHREIRRWQRTTVRWWRRWDSEATRLLADSLWAADRLRQAERRYSAVLRREPDNVGALWGRGSVRIARDRERPGVLDLERAVVLAPESVFARRMRGFAYAAAERYSEAIADFDHVLAIDPTSDGVQVSRAHCFVNMDEYSQAIRAFTQAITTDPQDATAWGGRGLAHYLADEPRQALVDLDRAITLSPNDQTYLQARASCYLELDQYDASLSDLDAAVGAKRAAIAARRLRWIVRRVRASDDGSQPPSQPEIPEMTEVVRNAIDSAVADLKSVALDTRALLVELMRVDTDPEWRHIRELCGDEDVIEASSTRDPVESFRLVWNIPAVTYTCEIALRASVEMAARYGLGPVSSGVLLLALLGDGTSAAGQALLAGGASHDEVVVAASELLGQELEDLDLGNSNTGGS